MKQEDIQFFLLRNKKLNKEKLIRFSPSMGMQYFALDGKWVNATRENFTKREDELTELTKEQAENFIDSKYQYFIRSGENTIYVRVINEIALEYLDGNGNWQEAPNNEWLLSLISNGDDYDVNYYPISINEVKKYREEIINSKKITR